jgi:hypothetical protein
MWPANMLLQDVNSVMGGLPGGMMCANIGTEDSADNDNGCHPEPVCYGDCPKDSGDDNQPVFD